MRLEIVSPEGIAWQHDNVDSVSLPLVGGQIQVLAESLHIIARYALHIFFNIHLNVDLKYKFMDFP